MAVQSVSLLLQNVQIVSAFHRVAQAKSETVGAADDGVGHPLKYTGHSSCWPGMPLRPSSRRHPSWLVRLFLLPASLARKDADGNIRRISCAEDGPWCRSLLPVEKYRMWDPSCCHYYGVERDNVKASSLRSRVHMHPLSVARIGDAQRLLAQRVSEGQPPFTHDFNCRTVIAFEQPFSLPTWEPCLSVRDSRSPAHTSLVWQRRAPGTRML